MAMLTLTKLFVNLMDTGAAVAQPSTDRTQEYTTVGEIRSYGGGRQRSISSAGEMGKYTFTQRQVTPAQLLLLRAWATQLVEVRTNKGERFFGTYFSVKVAEFKDISAYDVTIELGTVTADDSV